MGPTEYSSKRPRSKVRVSVGSSSLSRVRSMCLLAGPALGMPGEAVVGDGLPGCRVGDELAVRGTDAGVAVEGAHADEDLLVVVRAAAEEGRAALRAEGLLVAPLRPVDGDELLAARDPVRAGHGPRAYGSRAAGAVLAARAVTVAGVLRWRGQLVAN